MGPTRAAMALALLSLAGCPGPARTPASTAPCSEGTVPLLGACVAPSVGDAWCGPAARMSSSGACVYRTCAADEALDLDGDCDPLGAIVRTGPPCPAGAALVVAGRRTACVPAGEACPRGSSLQQDGGGRGAGSGSGKSCVPAPPLPRLDTSRPVDVGAWAATVLGPSGGPGSPATCRPLAQRPDLFGLTPGQSLTVRLSLRILAPDDDLSRIYAEVQVRSQAPLPAAGEALARSVVETSIEALRGAGTGLAGPVDLDIACSVRSF